MSRGLLYLDSSALVKLATPEPESLSLSGFLSDWPNQASSALARVETVRALRRPGGEAAAQQRAEEVLGRVTLIEMDSPILEAAALVDPAGLRSEVSAAIAQRLAERGAACEACSCSAAWLWLSRGDVPSLDDTERVAAAPGKRLCATHGARTLCRALAAFPDVNLFYINAPYGEAGAYVWI